MEQTAESQTVEEVIDGGGLPSAVEEQEASLEGFKITDELQQKYFKNGKFFGRFDNLEGMANALKSVEDKYANVMRKINSQPEPTQATEQSEPVDVATTVKPLMDEFVSNGMELTDELLQKAVEQGFDVRDVKLAAIEMKEKVSHAYSLVGGKDEYEAMLAWGNANLSEKQKIAFDKDLASNAGEWAIKGLYAEYKSKSQSQSTQEQPQRIMGDGSTSAGIRPYATQQEILRDKAYLNSPKGKSDLKALETYNKRMAKTPDSVVFGR